MSQRIRPGGLAVPSPRSSPELSVVVPLFNEEINVPALYRRLTAALVDDSYELIFVNDGSHDATPRLLDALQANDARVVVIHLSRNFGHQAAISAGIDHALGNAVVLMDGDLQDPPEVLSQFIAAWRAGNDVVYAVRTQRKEGLARRLAYAGFYRLWRLVSDLDVPLDSGDFCLMDRTVVDALRALPERQRFVRGLRAFVGFRQTGVRYERSARAAGTPKYTWRTLVYLALDGLVGFGSTPLNLVTYLGLGMAALAILGTVGLILALCSNLPIGGAWATVVLVVLYASALQLVSLGIVGEYVRRIFLETKGRPTYIVGAVKRRGPDAPPQPNRRGAARPILRMRPRLADTGRPRPAA
jgi:dolichol-phosphate mannosyltransferase